MNNKEENKLGMYKAVLNLLNNNTDKTGTIPAFAGLTTQLDNAIATIEAKHAEHQTVAKGAAQQKGAIEDRMVDSIVMLASVLYVYAVQNGNATLQTTVKTTESELKRMRDNELLERAQTIYQKGAEVAAELADFGVDQAKLDAINADVNAFADALSNQEMVSAEKTAARQALSEAFIAADNVLYNMLDPMMEIFQSTDGDFYGQYQSARVIKDL